MTRTLMQRVLGLGQSRRGTSKQLRVDSRAFKAARAKRNAAAAESRRRNRA